MSWSCGSSIDSLGASRISCGRWRHSSLWESTSSPSPRRWIPRLPRGRWCLPSSGAVAEFERSLIVERVRAGLRNAKAKGKSLGRPRVFVDAEESRSSARWADRGLRSPESCASESALPIAFIRNTPVTSSRDSLARRPPHPSRIARWRNFDEGFFEGHRVSRSGTCGHGLAAPGQSPLRDDRAGQGCGNGWLRSSRENSRRQVPRGG